MDTQRFGAENRHVFLVVNYTRMMNNFFLTFKFAEQSLKGNLQKVSSLSH